MMGGSSVGAAEEGVEVAAEGEAAVEEGVEAALLRSWVAP